MAVIAPFLQRQLYDEAVTEMEDELRRHATVLASSDSETSVTEVKKGGRRAWAVGQTNDDADQPLERRGTHALRQRRPQGVPSGAEKVNSWLQGSTDWSQQFRRAAPKGLPPSSLRGASRGRCHAGTVSGVLRWSPISTGAGRHVVSQHSGGWWLRLNLRGKLESLFPVISPTTRRKLAWDVLITMLVLYSAVTVPLAFSYGLPQSLELLIVEWGVTALYIIDILISFRTAYFDDDGNMVRDSWPVAQHYLTGWFLVDFLATVPLDLIAQAAGLGRTQSQLMILAVLKTPRLLRLIRLMRVLDRLRNANIFKVLQLILMMMMIAHWMACIWYLIARYSMTQEQWTFQSPWDNDQSKVTWYLSAFYYSFLLLIGDNISANNNYERVFFILSLIAGACFYSAVVGNMALLVANMNTVAVRFRQKLDMTQDALRYMKVPEGQRERVQAFYDYITAFNHPGSEGFGLLSELTKGINEDVHMFLHSAPLTRIYLFKDCEPAFIRSLGLRMKIVTFIPREVIFRQGDLGHEMYIIRSGCVSVLNRNREAMGLLQAGDFFGEIALLTQARRTAQCVALSTCDLAVLNSFDLKMLMKEFPDSANRLQAAARERLRQLQIAGRAGSSGTADDDPEGPEDLQRRQAEAQRRRLRARSISRFSIDCPPPHLQHLQQLHQQQQAQKDQHGQSQGESQSQGQSQGQGQSQSQGQGQQSGDEESCCETDMRVQVVGPEQVPATAKAGGRRPDSAGWEPEAGRGPGAFGSIVSMATQSFLAATADGEKRLLGDKEQLPRNCSYGHGSRSSCSFSSKFSAGELYGSDAGAGASGRGGVSGTRVRRMSSMSTAACEREGSVTSCFSIDTCPLEASVRPERLRTGQAADNVAASGGGARGGGGGTGGSSRPPPVVVVSSSAPSPRQAQRPGDDSASPSSPVLQGPSPSGRPVRAFQEPSDGGRGRAVGVGSLPAGTAAAGHGSGGGGGTVMPSSSGRGSPGGGGLVPAAAASPASGLRKVPVAEGWTHSDAVEAFQPSGDLRVQVESDTETDRPVGQSRWPPWHAHTAQKAAAFSPRRQALWGPQEGEGARAPAGADSGLGSVSGSGVGPGVHAAPHRRRPGPVAEALEQAAVSQARNAKVPLHYKRRAVGATAPTASAALAAAPNAAAAAPPAGASVLVPMMPHGAAEPAFVAAASPRPSPRPSPPPSSSQLPDKIPTHPIFGCALPPGLANASPDNSVSRRSGLHKPRSFATRPEGDASSLCSEALTAGGRGCGANTASICSSRRSSGAGANGPAAGRHSRTSPMRLCPAPDPGAGPGSVGLHVSDAGGGPTASRRSNSSLVLNPAAPSGFAAALAATAASIAALAHSQPYSGGGGSGGGSGQQQHVIVTDTGGGYCLRPMGPQARVVASAPASPAVSLYPDGAYCIRTGTTAAASGSAAIDAPSSYLDGATCPRTSDQPATAVSAAACTSSTVPSYPDGSHCLRATGPGYVTLGDAGQGHRRDVSPGSRLACRQQEVEPSGTVTARAAGGSQSPLDHAASLVVWNGSAHGSVRGSMQGSIPGSIVGSAGGGCGGGGGTPNAGGAAGNAGGGGGRDGTQPEGPYSHSRSSLSNLNQDSGSSWNLATLAAASTATATSGGTASQLVQLGSRTSGPGTSPANGIRHSGQNVRCAPADFSYSSARQPLPVSPGRAAAPPAFGRSQPEGVGGREAYTEAHGAFMMRSAAARRAEAVTSSVADSDNPSARGGGPEVPVGPLFPVPQQLVVALRTVKRNNSSEAIDASCHGAVDGSARGVVRRNGTGELSLAAGAAGSEDASRHDPRNRQTGEDGEGLTRREDGYMRGSTDVQDDPQPTQIEWIAAGRPGAAKRRERNTSNTGGPPARLVLPAAGGFAAGGGGGGGQVPLGVSTHSAAELVRRETELSRRELDLQRREVELERREADLARWQAEAARGAADAASKQAELLSQQELNRSVHAVVLVLAAALSELARKVELLGEWLEDTDAAVERIEAQHTHDESDNDFLGLDQAPLSPRLPGGDGLTGSVLLERTTSGADRRGFGLGLGPGVVLGAPGDKRSVSGQVTASPSHRSNLNMFLYGDGALVGGKLPIELAGGMVERSVRAGRTGLDGGGSFLEKSIRGGKLGLGLGLDGGGGGGGSITDKSIRGGKFGLGLGQGLLDSGSSSGGGGVGAGSDKSIRAGRLALGGGSFVERSVRGSRLGMDDRSVADRSMRGAARTNPGAGSSNGGSFTEQTSSRLSSAARSPLPVTTTPSKAGDRSPTPLSGGSRSTGTGSTQGSTPPGGGGDGGSAAAGARSPLPPAASNFRLGSFTAAVSGLGAHLHRQAAVTTPALTASGSAGSDGGGGGRSVARNALSALRRALPSPIGSPPVVQSAAEADPGPAAAAEAPSPGAKRRNSVMFSSEIEAIEAR